VPFSPFAAAALPAFPGAQGFGAEPPGGRGGRAIFVTNLNDGGPGSLREAYTAKGPRTIIFRVGGAIALERHLRITEPYLAIAGQTAPGDGILIRNAGLQVDTHDVVIRHLRVRIGASRSEAYDSQDCLHIEGKGAHDIVVDHCSFSWSIDETVGVSAGAHDVTPSWNIMAEPLERPFSAAEIGEERKHAYAVTLGGHPDRVTLHHNLVAHAEHRNPRIQGGLHEFSSSFVYD